MSASRIGNTVLIHKDNFAYISHPSIVSLDNGEWLAAFNHSCRREPRLHPPADPLFRTLLCRSKDQGETWEPPCFAPDFDWYGTECPGIAQLGNGDVVLSEFRFGWYPIHLARKRHAQGEPVAIRLPDKGWTTEIAEQDWDRSAYPWGRIRHGVYAHISADRGRTFERSVKIDCAPWGDGYSRTGVTECRDGRVAYALTEYQTPRNGGSTFVVFSNDGCRSWEKPVAIHESEERRFGEPDTCEVGPGELYCVLRDSSRTKYLYGCRSMDGGKTWTEPERTPMYGFPGQLLLLGDGRLLCTYGLREAPFGIRACVSEDGGRAWQIDDEIVIRDDLPNGDLGYPTTIEYAPGRLFCCYYGQEPDGVTCVQGTYVEL